MSYRLNTVTVDLKRLTDNARVMKGCLAPGTRMMAVIKANAYGHGIIQAAAAFNQTADCFGVADPDEGIRLRDSGVQKPILLFCPATPGAAEVCAANSLTQTVADRDSIPFIEAAAARLGVTVSVHIKIDSGMNRIGLCDRVTLSSLLEAIAGSGHVKLTGVYTHFADTDDAQFTKTQLQRFLNLCELIPPGVTRHCAASGAVLCYPETQLDMVRPGIALYGCPPAGTNLPLRPAMRWTTAVVFLKTVPAGQPIGYGCAYMTVRETRVATLSAGYADGYRRSAAETGYVLIEGLRARLLGRVCMDFIMADVTDIPGVQIGSAAILMGEQGHESITPEDVGRFFGSIPHEALLAPSFRVKREWENFSADEGKRCFGSE